MTQTQPFELSQAEFRELFKQCSNWGRWGADDERGTLNLITPEQTKRAAALVQQGVSVSCAWPLNTVPSSENRSPALHLMVRAGDVADAVANRSTADYLALAPHGLAHSHLDALCHVSWEGKLYNDRPVSVVTSNGALKNAITIGQDGIVTRGVLLDIPLVKGMDSLEPGAAISPTDLEEAESAAGIRVEPGDVLMIRTGRHRRQALHGTWDTGKLMAGLHFTCMPWIKERGVALLGSDGISDVRPSAVEGTTLPIHTLTLTAMGMQLLDNLNLDDLADACSRFNRWEFWLTIAPLRLERGTASAVNPIAVF
ncbi:MAG TPA: cyclase family protein [Chloroflexota bacterium]|nr:cyclase family protein [Chloroflexota bacterium]